MGYWEIDMSSLSDKVLKEVFAKYMKTEKKKHAEFSFSGSERWDNCHGSNELIKKAPPQKDNVWGIRGTNTHTLIEFIFREGIEFLDGKAAIPFKKFLGFDGDMLTNAVDTVNHIKMLHKKMPGSKLLIEQKVSIKGVGFGTSDVVLYVRGGILHIMDYKNGTSLVHPEENLQMMCYAIGVCEMLGWNWTKVLLTIIQPNAAHSEGPIRTWTTSIYHLKKVRERLILSVKKSREPNAKLVPNPKYCYWCPANLICPAMQQKALVKMNEKFKKPNQFVQFNKPQHLEPLQIANLLNAREYIKIFSDELETYTKCYLGDGGEIPGWDLNAKGQLIKCPTTKTMKGLDNYGKKEKVSRKEESDWFDQN